MLLLRLLLLVLLAPLALLAKLLGLGRRDMIVLPDDHPEMANAIRQAKATLPDFERLLVSPEPGMTHFGVKVRFPTDTGHEHCWVNELELRESGLSGKLGNHLQATTEPSRSGLRVGWRLTLLRLWGSGLNSRRARPANDYEEARRAWNA